MPGEDLTKYSLEINGKVSNLTRDVKKEFWEFFHDKFKDVRRIKELEWKEMKSHDPYDEEVWEGKSYKNMDVGDRVMIVGEDEPFAGYIGTIEKFHQAQFSSNGRKYLMVRFDILGLLPMLYKQLKLVNKPKRIYSENDPYAEEQWEGQWEA